MRLVDQVSSVSRGITKVCCKIWQGEQALSPTLRSCRTLVAWSQSHLLGYVQGTCHVPLPPTMPATLGTGSPCGPAAARRAAPCQRCRAHGLPGASRLARTAAHQRAQCHAVPGRHCGRGQVRVAAVLQLVDGKTGRSCFRCVLDVLMQRKSMRCAPSWVGSVLDVEMTILDKHPEGISIDE